MKGVLSSLVFALFITGCATVHDPSLLYGEYSHYENGVNKNNIIEVASNFFSPSLLGNEYQTDPDATSQLLFKNYMVSTDSHYESANDLEGCLTINGYDEENFPLIFSLKYISRKGHWLIDNIHVVFVESKEDFSSSAKCPSEYPN